MKRFAIGLTVFLLILLITAGLALLGYYHLSSRSSSDVLASGSGEALISVSGELAPSQGALPLEESVPELPISSESSQPAGPSEPSEPASSSSQPSEPSEPASRAQELEPMETSEEDQWRLMLVNQTHLLPEDYSFEKAEIEGGFTFDARAAEALIQMLSDGRAAGYSLRVVSTFRTVERSEYLYTNKIAEYQSIGYSAADAAVEAGRWIAPPRTSEHNAGLAIDVVSSDYDQVYGDLMHEFEQFPSFAWLSTHCAEYGFVLRYPKDKQEITGITYEPWHYRYVGVEHARKMQELGMCLEEYVEWIEQQTAG